MIWEWAFCWPPVRGEGNYSPAKAERCNASCSLTMQAGDHQAFSARYFVRFGPIADITINNPCGSILDLVCSALKPVFLAVTLQRDCAIVRSRSDGGVSNARIKRADNKKD